MYKLLEINNTVLPNPEGSYEINKKDKYNEYEGEDGTSTIEVIRQGVVSLSVTYNGLTEKKLHDIVDAISLVSSVKLFDPTIRTIRTITAKITNIKTTKLWYRNNASLWKLSFSIEEL